MSAEKRLDLTPLTVRLAAAWVAAGALFKLFSGTPSDLPAVLHELPVSIDLFFKSAIGIELAIVTLALLRPRLAWLPLVGMYVVFEGILAWILSSGAESCGCFGSKVEISPGMMMAIDTLLLLGILVSRPWKSKHKGVGPLLAVPVLGLVCLIAPFPIVGDQSIKRTEDGGAADLTEHRYVVFSPVDWKDKLIYETEFADLFPAEIETLPTDGLYIFWRWDCDHCAEHLEHLAAADDMSQPIVLVRLEQEWDNDENQVVITMPAGGHVTELSLPAGPSYTVETPADFVLEGGLVVSAREGIQLEGHEH